MTRTPEPFDVVVLGGGPGGYATALRAGQRGLRVAIVEGGRVGGTCLHRGCVPSKALLHVAALAAGADEARRYGLAGPGPGIDLDAVRGFRDGVVERMHGGLRTLVESRAELVGGWGTVIDAATVRVDTPEGGIRWLHARDLVVAVGSRPVTIASLAVDGEHILDSDGALGMARVPLSAIVVGAGAVGVEFASIWRDLGSEVTVVDAVDRVLPNEDDDVSAALAAALGRRGVDLRLSTTVTGCTPSPGGVEVALADGTTLAADTVLVAVGRAPATAGLGLEALDVLDDRGHVKVDAHGRTAVEGLWAVGDVVPTLALAHAAFAEGFVVADTIAGLDPEPVAHHLVPRVTFCRPEVASVGWTEREARAARDDVAVTRTTLAGNARAAIEGEAGLVKLVTAGDGELLGAHVVGPGATELVGELGLAVAWGALAAEVADVVHAHPTVGESIREAALAAAGLPFHGH